jgi:hypothetical protein
MIVDGEPDPLFLGIVELFYRAYDRIKESIKPKTPEEKERLEELDYRTRLEFIALMESKGYHFSEELKKLSKAEFLEKSNRARKAMTLSEIERKRSEIMSAVKEDLSNLSKKEENPRVTDLYHDGEEITLCVSAGNVYLYLHFENAPAWESFKKDVNGQIADLNKPRRPKK